MLDVASNSNPEFLTIKEVMGILKCSQSSIYRWINIGHFPQPVKFGNCARWSREDIDEFLKNARQGNNDNGPRPRGIIRGRPSHIATPEAAEKIRKRREKTPYTPRRRKNS